MFFATCLSSILEYLRQKSPFPGTPMAKKGPRKLSRRGMFSKSVEKAMDTPLAKGTNVGENSPPAEDLLPNK